jgi:hypothetical protein
MWPSTQQLLIKLIIYKLTADQYYIILLTLKPEEKRPLERPRHRWVENIKLDLREIGWDGMGWIGLIWLRIGTGGWLL